MNYGTTNRGCSRDFIVVATRLLLPIYLTSFSLYSFVPTDWKQLDKACTTRFHNVCTEIYFWVYNTSYMWTNGMSYLTSLTCKSQQKTNNKIITNHLLFMVQKKMVTCLNSLNTWLDSSGYPNINNMPNNHIYTKKNKYAFCAWRYILDQPAVHRCHDQMFYNSTCSWCR